MSSTRNLNKEMDLQRARVSGQFLDDTAVEYAAACQVEQQHAQHRIRTRVLRQRREAEAPQPPEEPPAPWPPASVTVLRRKPDDDDVITDYRPTMHSHVPKKNRYEFIHQQNQQPQLKPMRSTFKQHDYPPEVQPDEQQNWHGARWERQGYSFPYGKCPRRLVARQPDWRRHRDEQWEAAAFRHTIWDVKYRGDEGKQLYDKQREQHEKRTLRKVQRRRDAKEAGTKPPCRAGYQLNNKAKKYEALRKSWQLKNPGKKWVSVRPS